VPRGLALALFLFFFSFSFVLVSFLPSFRAVSVYKGACRRGNPRVFEEASEQTVRYRRGRRTLGDGDRRRRPSQHASIERTGI
jgi:hypothetical protein